MTPIGWRSDSARLRIIVAAGMLAGLALTPKLWLSGRLYPLTPVFPALQLPYPWDWALYLALLASVAAIGIFPKPRTAVWIFAGLIALAAALDQSRWQPWAWQYTLMLLAFAAAKPETPAAVARLIVGLTYLWSGLQKLNPKFASDVFNWMIEPFAPHLPHRLLEIAQWSAYGAPYLEAAIGIALLTGKLRRPAIFAAIGMHLFIMLCIGPLGRNLNTVVWPWNFVMIACLFLLFWRAGPVWVGGGCQWAVLVMYGLMPALSFFNLWDAYLSVALYSGNQTTGVIYIRDAVFERMPDALDDNTYDEGPGWYSLSVNDWSYEELNVPVYSEPRVWKNVARWVCRYEESPGDVTLDLSGRWGLANRLGNPMYQCRDLR